MLINGSIGKSDEYRDYQLIKELYHCKPSDLENEDENTLSLHYQIMIKEYEAKSGKKLESDIHKPKTKTKPESNGLNIIESTGTPLPDPDKGDVTFVDISSLEKLAAHTKKTFDAKDLLG